MMPTGIVRCKGAEHPGRASKRKNCTRRAVPIGGVERLVADCYQDISITEARYTAPAAQVEAAFDERLASRSQELAALTENRKRLRNESEKLLAAHLAATLHLQVGCATTYARTDDPGRRLANQAQTGGIELGEDGEAAIRLAGDTSRRRRF
ncbi:hypothetical protein [Leucobacter sp. wl10]|uniref:hypothetical protein n=1 Tax=Leucobacter sp. wl10 TaxID=2304677 RepID=UPI000E5ADAEC|nr:hypothetical protein [Leucobacter sp. wl10]RGE21422.1 hypothetical protein D1J51_06145 [Leucobacter sp. wl10]